MPLPRITSPVPVVVPATTEKAYPEAYQVGLHLETPPDGPWTAVIETVPYNYDAQEVQPGARPTHHVYRDVYTLAAARNEAGKPALLHAITAVATAVAELIAEG